jgi:hypothetical protein
MTEAQVWTVIGVFTALFLGGMTTVSTLFVHVIRSEVGGLRAELRSETRRIDDKLDTRFDSLDRDVQVLSRHTFGTDQQSS